MTTAEYGKKLGTLDKLLPRNPALKMLVCCDIPNVVSEPGHPSEIQGSVPFFFCNRQVGLAILGVEVNISKRPWVNRDHM